MRLRVLACLLAVAALAGGCGSRSSASSPRDATLVLDFTPNAIHAGIYTAVARGDDSAEHVHLRILAPTASTDSIKLLDTGRANFAILDIHDLAIARARGADVVGIMAIVERPLAAVIAAPSIGDPRMLEGRLVGVTGDPSDDAVLRSIVGGDSGDPAKLRTITIGFNAVAALLAGRVAGATAFWNDEGVTLAHDRPGFHIFRVEQYGAPPYPELVLCATHASLERDPALVRAVVHALVRGYEQTLADPAAGAADLEGLVPGLDRREVAEQLAVELPAFRGPHGAVGELDPATLRAWAAWEARFGIVQRPPDVEQAFDESFLARAS
jgi:ABC-type nitrate/sulfonate/bicarbonate transport system substrate-binding protein